MRYLLCAVSLLICISGHAEDDIVIGAAKLPSPWEREMAAASALHDFYLKQARSISRLKPQDTKEEEAHLEKFARELDSIPAPEPDPASVENTRSNNDKIRTSAEENLAIRPAFHYSDSKPGEVLTYTFPLGDFKIVEVGPVRLVYKSPGYSTTGTHGNCLHGFGSGSGYSSGASGERLDVFASYALYDKAYCLADKLVIKVDRTQLTLCGHHFALDGKKAIVFMYDETTIDKIVVLNH